MTTFDRSIEIAASPDRVWEVMYDVERWHEWTPSVSRIRRIGGGPLAVGSRALIWQPKFPPALWKVTDLQPGREFTWVSTVPGLRVTGRHGVEASGAGARATLRLSLEGLFGDWFGRVTGPITNQYLDFEASGLKARSEHPDYTHRG